jgi:hypothetical protein
VPRIHQRSLPDYGYIAGRSMVLVRRPGRVTRKYYKEAGH